MRPLSEYDPYDREFTFWRERLSIDEGGYYVITMLLSDFDLIESPKNVEFSMVISNPINSRSNPIGIWFWTEYNQCNSPDWGPLDTPEDNEIQTPMYFLRYKTYRDVRYPFDLIYAIGSNYIKFFSEKIADLSNDVVLNRVKSDYRGEYWSSCDPYNDSADLIPVHPSIFITERIESYDFSHNMYLELKDNHNIDRGFYLRLSYYWYYWRKPVIPTPMFPDRRLDFYMSDGSIQPFCYGYSPGDAITKYPYYSYIECASTCHTSWKNLNYKPVPYGFGVGDNPFLVYIGFPAIGDDIIYPSDCIDYDPGGQDLTFVSPHMVIFDPAIVTGDIS